MKGGIRHDEMVKNREGSFFFFFLRLRLICGSIEKKNVISGIKELYGVRCVVKFLP